MSGKKARSQKPCGVVYCSIMRIIAGSKRGMKLLGPGTYTSRPITDRVKESLFSVLYKYDLPDGAKVADLFSGVGSMGLEALSRGAQFVTFVEQDPKVISSLKRNIEKAGFVKNSKVIKANAFGFGDVFQTDIKYNLIFVDPPYARTKDVREESPLGILLGFLSEHVAEDGIIIVRTSKDVSLLERYDRFKVIERRQWGTMAVTILKKMNL